jgi:hypothetical protein
MDLIVSYLDGQAEYGSERLVKVMVKLSPTIINEVPGHEDVRKSAGTTSPYLISTVDEGKWHTSAVPPKILVYK